MPHHHDSDHEHNHSHPEMDKLQQVLPYLVKHSSEHIEEAQKWVRLAEEAHQPGVAEQFEQVLRLYEEIARHYRTAADKLGL